jgi:prefoldin subunit 5
MLLLAPQAKSAVSAAERDRKQLEEQLQAVSQGIEEATAALQDLQRQIKAAGVGQNHCHMLA